jgi:type II secretory pathway pseudopilin PulG
MRNRTQSSARRLSHGGARGFSLVEAALLVLLIGSAVAAGLMVMRAKQPTRQAQAQEAALQWADQALVAYAAAHARLPCAVATPTSDPDDCVSGDQKGWLPVQALEAVHPGGASIGEPLRYVVYRGDAGSDLATASDRFSPHTWERTPHDFSDSINGLDLCAALSNAARETASAVRGDRARTTDIDGNAINVAYGLGVAGATPGDAGGRFDGGNQTAAAVLESPARGTDSRYDDRVRVRDFNTLAQSLGCGYASAANPDGLALASLDMLALAVDVSDEVAEQRESTLEDTQLAVGLAATSEVFAILNVALAGASISNSVSTLATASAQLSAAIASCVVLVGCGLIPPYTAAVTAAGVAIGLASGATGLSAGALAATTAALALTIEARDMAQRSTGSSATDLTAVTEQTCTSAEGGLVYWTTDAFGAVVPVVAGIYKPGLKQEVDLIQAELSELLVDQSTTSTRLVDLEQIPSVSLIDYPAAPVRADGESDASWSARYQAWLDTRRQQELQLQAKLEAIRAAEQAHFDWDKAVQAAENAKKELERMQEGVAQLQPLVAACNAAPPPATDVVRAQQCNNQRQSLVGMTTCDLNILTSGQVRQRQCLPWKVQDHDAAIAARNAAKTAYDQAQATAVFMAEPPIKDYISNSGWWLGVWDCSVLAWCDPLIVWNQDDDDKRETYAKLVYKKLGLTIAIEKKQLELDDKRQAYETAQAQCDVLRNLASTGSTGGAEQPPVWSGASAILRAANCKGATGAVTPSTCAGGTP